MGLPRDPSGVLVSSPRPLPDNSAAFSVSGPAEHTLLHGDRNAWATGAPEEGETQKHPGASPSSVYTVGMPGPQAEAGTEGDRPLLRSLTLYFCVLLHRSVGWVLQRDSEV